MNAIFKHVKNLFFNFNFNLYILQRIVENLNVSVCMNELLCLEYGEFRVQNKLRATRALFTALDSVSDAVEIADENRDIQVISRGL